MNSVITPLFLYVVVVAGVSCACAKEACRNCTTLWYGDGGTRIEESQVHTCGIILSGVWDARFVIVIGMNESSRLKTKAFFHQADMDSY